MILTKEQAKKTKTTFQNSNPSNLYQLFDGMLFLRSHFSMDQITVNIQRTLIEINWLPAIDDFEYVILLGIEKIT